MSYKGVSHNFAVLLFLCMETLPVMAHPGHHHGTQTHDSKKALAEADLKLAYLDIEREYAKTVQPIFDNKCAACHSNLSPSPWYSKIPGVNQLIERDRSEAKEHLEISQGFPFAGHGEPWEDLNAIKEAVIKGTMPTTIYSFMHSSSKLTQDERDKVLIWVEKSKAKLSTIQTTETK